MEATEKKLNCTPLYPTTSPQEIVLAAATIALTLSQGRTINDIETVINLLNLTTANLRSILVQKVINNKINVELDITI